MGLSNTCCKQIVSYLQPNGLPLLVSWRVFINHSKYRGENVDLYSIVFSQVESSCSMLEQGCEWHKGIKGGKISIFCTVEG